MTNDSKFNDNFRPPKDRAPLEFDEELARAVEEVKKVIIEEEKEG